MANAAEIHIKRSEKSWTAPELLKAQEFEGRRKGKPHGSFIVDLADLRKVVLLCPVCNSKFDWKRHRFRHEKEFRYVGGKCDACRTYDMHCSMYVPEETYTQVRSTADERRTLAKRRDVQIRTKGYL